MDYEVSNSVLNSLAMFKTNDDFVTPFLGVLDSLFLSHWHCETEFLKPRPYRDN